jgi:hypothetical protein
MPMKMPLPDIQRLAVRLHHRGATPLGSDSSQSQSDMLLASHVIPALLHEIDGAGRMTGLVIMIGEAHTCRCLS